MVRLKKRKTSMQHGAGIEATPHNELAVPGKRSKNKTKKAKLHDSGSDQMDPMQSAVNRVLQTAPRKRKAEIQVSPQNEFAVPGKHSKTQIKKKAKLRDPGPNHIVPISESLPEREHSKYPKDPPVGRAAVTSVRPTKKKRKIQKGKELFSQESNRLLSVLDELLDPSEKKATEWKSFTMSDSEEEQPLNGRVWTGELRTESTDNSLTIEKQSQPVSLTATAGSEESDAEFRPEEEKSKALSVMAKVLEQDSDHDEPSDLEHEDMHGKRSAPVKKCRKLFIANLPFRVDAETIEQDFEKYGEIDTFNMPLNKQNDKPMGIAFIVYLNEESVERALAQNGQTYRERKIRVTVADPTATGKDKPATAAASKDAPQDGSKGKGKTQGQGLRDHFGGEHKGKSKGKGKDDRTGKGQGKSKHNQKGKSPSKGKHGNMAVERI